MSLQQDIERRVVPLPRPNQPVDLSLGRPPLALVAHFPQRHHAGRRIKRGRLQLRGSLGDEGRVGQTKLFDQRRWGETAIFLQFARKIQHRS